MFAPAEMAEVDIFVFENDVEVVAQAVARLEVMHLLDVNTLGKWAEGVGTEWAGRISTYATQERRVKELLVQLGIEDTHQACEGRLNPSEEMLVIEGKLHDSEVAVHDLRDRTAEVKRELEKSELIAKSMEILAPLSVSISDLRELQHLHLVAGTIPAVNLARLEASLFRIPYSIIPVYHYEKRVLVFAFCAEEHAPILDRALESAFLDPLALPAGFGGTAQEALQQIEQQIIDANQKLTVLDNERKTLADQIAPELLEILARIQGDRAIAEAMAHFGHRGRVYLIAGWVPKNRVPDLRQAVESATEGRVTFEENTPFIPGDHTKIPTLLRHSRLLRSVEGLVATYGVPGYREIDPTLLIGVTFVLMFGVMFGDLGQGLVLAILGLALAFRLIPRFANQAGTGVIVAACGLSASVFGLLYGSFFGMENVIPALWLRPMTNIFTLLEVSVVFGVLVLNIGFAFHLITAVREGTVKESIFDKNGIVGLALYWCLGVIVILIATGKTLPTWLDALTVILMLALFFGEPLTNLVTGERPIFHGSITEISVQAFFELFEALISYVSNTLSYVRLGAFAIAHVGLSTVVILLAHMVGTGFSGEILQILILILGNIVIIGFEGGIVAIQTLRLEYYELFGKFYKGEGTPFIPLTLPKSECKPLQPISERSKP
jgi:V/A-type H+/Na+-transporting ATPase subunit I